MAAYGPGRLSVRRRWLQSRSQDPVRAPGLSPWQQTGLRSPWRVPSAWLPEPGSASVLLDRSHDRNSRAGTTCAGVHGSPTAGGIYQCSSGKRSGSCPPSGQNPERLSVLPLACGDCSCCGAAPGRLDQHAGDLRARSGLGFQRPGAQGVHLCCTEFGDRPAGGGVVNHH